MIDGKAGDIVWNWRRNKRAYMICLFLLAGGCLFLCACGEENTDSHTAADAETATDAETAADTEIAAEEQTGQEMSAEQKDSEALAESGQSAQYNEKRFFECAAKWEVDRAEAESHYRRLCEDNVFRNQTAWLVWADIEDLDQNGQPDMAVMVKDDEYSGYGEGCIYFYMNEDEPYCFRDEEYPFHFGFDLIPGDFDNDGNTEIAFESLGSGVGAAGDWHPRILKYKNHTMEPVDFPGDDYDGRGIRIEITQEEKWDTYSAYCAYMDDTIVFEAENIADPDASQPCGGNSRGYFNLWRSDYEGRDALEVSEYLYGEGGIAHGLGLAKFLIVWDENGEGEIVKWWVEPFDT